MNTYICVTCGTRYQSSASTPKSCPVCEDDRQYIHPDGQQWTTLEELKQQGYKNLWREVEPGLDEIVTIPRFGIGQRAMLLQTDAGNILWDCITYLDEETVEYIRDRGGLKAIVISHPHFYSNFHEWAEAFDCPVYLHEADRKWVMGPGTSVRLWSGETLEVVPGVTAVRLGGHFPGSAFLHWQGGAGGEGAILTGDTLYVTAGNDRVSFMYSFPNLIPLPARELRRIRSVLETWDFANIHAAWSGKSIWGDGKSIALSSAERYLEILES
ncbi:hypothetical protein GCM10011571_19730 [Marinithermofilum abyssi]|jgi:glyoxylase-like metal-dependent hydrolase (beta-lactamase superfamily II)|uniref:Metallo-beta-lactamase domain-containing protein n=1 Tax=Marinithermofilum abyssi TaxID=1571185 RepID=A0A8J2VIR8_9BACL|nr:MBL fold metallo-hydrolase [Marinithermofilum abyssi]GGE17980.1 hypothetical protein GCM10011571_19730 [Marinithermofilum abyssi]